MNPKADALQADDRGPDFDLDNVGDKKSSSHSLKSNSREWESEFEVCSIRSSLLVPTQVTSREHLSNFVREFSRGDRRGIGLHVTNGSVVHSVWRGDTFATN